MNNSTFRVRNSASPPKPKNSEPSPKLVLPIAIKVSFEPHRIVEITRHDRGSKTYRIHNNPTPTSFRRVTLLADKLSLLRDWPVYPNIDGWMVVQTQFELLGEVAR